jgi:hypothetical protein
VRLRINSKVQAALNEEQRTELSKGKQEASEAVAEVSQQLGIVVRARAGYALQCRALFRVVARWLFQLLLEAHGWGI